MANTQVATLQSAPALSPDGPSNEELEKVKSELEAKQLELEALKATAEVAASLIQAPEDGSKSVAELVQEQVEQISSRLTAEHNQRISDEEDKYTKRTNSMKTQLSKKLSDGKQAIRDQERAEHDKAMDQLKSEHLAELERLRAEHQKEIQTLRVEAGAGNSVAVGKASGDPTQVHGAKPAEWTPSPEQIKEFVGSNPHVKKIITGNIEKQVNQQKDTWIAQIKQEEEKIWKIKFEEATKAANEAKEKAVELEGKKMKVKLNMLDGRAKTVTAQINVVKKAAEETPQRAVIEVWEEAKIAKALPVAPLVQTSATSSTTPSAPVPTTQQQQQRHPQATMPTTPSPAPSTPAAIQVARPAANTFTPRNSTSDNPFNPSKEPPIGPGQSTPGGFGAPSGMPAGRVPSPFAGNAQQPTSGPNTNQPQQQSNMPRPTQPVGTGPAALRNIAGQNQGQGQNPALNQPLSSGIPRPGAAGGIPRGGRAGYQGHARGGMHPQQPQQGFGHQQQDLIVTGAARGASNLPRGPGGVGRGGRGRGQVNTQGQQGQHGGPNSPGGGRGGSLNPGARQFNPNAGTKRPHEGGEGGNAEKKARGQGE